MINHLFPQLVAFGAMSRYDGLSSGMDEEINLIGAEINKNVEEK